MFLRPFSGFPDHGLDGGNIRRIVHEEVISCIGHAVLSGRAIGFRIGIRRAVEEEEAPVMEFIHDIIHDALVRR